MSVAQFEMLSSVDVKKGCTLSLLYQVIQRFVVDLAVLHLLMPLYLIKWMQCAKHSSL